MSDPEQRLTPTPKGKTRSLECHRSRQNEIINSSNIDDERQCVKQPGRQKPEKLQTKVPLSSTDTGCQESITHTKAAENMSAWNDWQPMRIDHESVQNLIRVDQCDPLGFNLAVGGLRVTSFEETPCKFYNGRGEFCWKGQLCPYKHEKGVHTAETNYVDIGKEECRTLSELEAKPPIVREACLRVIITHIVSPAEFYAMPEESWRCACEKVGVANKEVRRQDRIQRAMKQRVKGESEPVVPTAINTDISERKRAAMEALERNSNQGRQVYEKLTKGLNDYLNEGTTWRKLQTASYELLELVAVKTDDPEAEAKQKWSRGVIYEIDVKSAYDRKIPWFTVQLIDEGPMLTVEADSLCKLPKGFCVTPGLVYKCMLDEVVPVRFTWHQSAIEMFRQLALNKLVLLTINKTPGEIDAKLLLALNREAPYLVTLTSSEGDDLKATNIAQKLADAGKAVAFRQFPYRPYLSTAIKIPHPVFLSKSYCTQQSSILADQIIETQRVKDNIDECMNMDGLQKSIADGIALQNVSETERIEIAKAEKAKDEKAVEEIGKEEMVDAKMSKNKKNRRKGAKKQNSFK